MFVCVSVCVYVRACDMAATYSYGCCFRSNFNWWKLCVRILGKLGPGYFAMWWFSCGLYNTILHSMYYTIMWPVPVHVEHGEQTRLDSVTLIVQRSLRELAPHNITWCICGIFWNVRDCVLGGLVSVLLKDTNEKKKNTTQPNGWCLLATALMCRCSESQNHMKMW